MNIYMYSQADSRIIGHRSLYLCPDIEAKWNSLLKAAEQGAAWETRYEEKLQETLNLEQSDNQVWYWEKGILKVLEGEVLELCPQE